MIKNKKVLGVIGGLGPIATAHFMELAINMCDAKCDQENLDMIIYNIPSIPDRTAYILDNSKESPLPRMVEIGHTLTEQGADQIAIPCVTAHYFCDELDLNISAPIINGVRETVAYLKDRNISKVGIMATDGTISSGLFAKELEAAGITPVIPSKDGQAAVMHLIYNNIKAGTAPDMNKFAFVRDELFSLGAEAIILGCTELSLIKRDYTIGAGFIDVMEVLASQSLQKCDKKVKEEYKNLITV